MSPYGIIQDFEKAIAKYTGAPYVVCVNSCTNALLLSLLWFKEKGLENLCIYIPHKTYVGVAQSVLNAGYMLKFKHSLWQGGYQLDPLPIMDYAKRFTSGMYQPGFFQCVSFQASKILNIEHGGAILLDNREAYHWLRRARFDGRNEGVNASQDMITQRGYHCLMAPSHAAQGLLKLYSLPDYNVDQQMDNYPDLSQMEIFK